MHNHAGVAAGGREGGGSGGEVGLGGWRVVSYSCNQGSVRLYVGQPMSANKSNYHRPLRENKP